MDCADERLVRASCPSVALHLSTGPTTAAVIAVSLPNVVSEKDTEKSEEPSDQTWTRVHAYWPLRSEGESNRAQGILGQ